MSLDPIYPDDVSADELIRIEKICDEFEFRVLKQLEVCIEDLIARESRPAIRNRLLSGLIEIELDNSGLGYTQSQFKKYQERFPDDRHIVAKLFQSKDLTIVPDQQQRTVSSGVLQIPEMRLPPDHEIDKYRIVKCIGTGSFGTVYQAWDTELERNVALKIAHHDSTDWNENYQRSVAEARSSAKLKADGIATIFDFRVDEHRVYIVQEFVEGRNLGQLIADQSLTIRDSVALVKQIATAISHAHDQSICHRDLKPNNIIIDADGKPTVVDFGLALHTNSGITTRVGIFGTPSYMSPEQVRGEINRTDATSDVWALGVILYELLTGKRPFEADDEEQIFAKIQNVKPRPLREWNKECAGELERIVLQCLAKKKRSRYSNARLLADDLELYMERHGQSLEEPKVGPAVVPRGLRAFGPEDNDFFLQLLPGYPDRHGLPESIAFWKHWVERDEPSNSSSVGLIYGVSGCGKTSFVSAGLLPLLPQRVITLFVEATPNETEIRLFGALRKQFPGLSDEMSLPSAFARLRDGQFLRRGQKLLIVVDQFEQWLSNNHEQQRLQLANALRHCDGENLQALLLIREDFWPDTSQFMDDLEIPLLQNENCVRLELLDKEHARQILAQIGKAYDKLEDEPTNAQSQFLEQAINDLAEDGKIVSIKLALFAETFRSRDWTVEALEKLGGVNGVGVVFLNDKFVSDRAPLEYKTLFSSAQDCLFAMLPNDGSDLKGHMQSRTSLQEVSGHIKNDGMFEKLIHVLDQELRLITPTSPTQHRGGNEGSGETANETHYQLSHDYLVPILRNWIDTEKRRFLTWRVRQRMARVSAIWQEVPDKRYLPSWWENLLFRLFTNSKTWTPVQQEMMLSSGRRHFATSLIGSLVLLAMLFVFTLAGMDIAANRKVATLRSAKLGDLASEIDGLRVPDQRLIAKLQREIGVLSSKIPVDDADQREIDRQKLNIAIALANFESSNWEHVVKGVFTVPNEKLEQLSKFLEPRKKEVVSEFTSFLNANPNLRNEAAKRRAIVLGYLGNVEALTKLALDSPTKEVREFAGVLEKHREEAIDSLNRQLGLIRTEVFASPSESLEAEFDRRGGVVDRLGAVVFSLPLEYAEDLIRRCFSERYIPVSFRPFLSEDGSEHVAIAWNRNTEFTDGDVEDCILIKSGMRLNQFREVTKSTQKRGWRLADISFFNRQTDKGMLPSFSCLWFRNDRKLPFRLDLDITNQELDVSIETNLDDEFQIAKAFSRCGKDGEPRFTILWEQVKEGLTKKIDPVEYRPKITFLGQRWDEIEGADLADCQIAAIDLSNRYLFDVHCEVHRRYPVLQPILSNPSVRISHHLRRKVSDYSLSLRLLGDLNSACLLCERLRNDLPQWKDREFEIANALAYAGDAKSFQAELDRLTKLNLSEGESSLSVPLINLRYAVRSDQTKLAKEIYEDLRSESDRLLEKHKGNPRFVGEIYRVRIRANLIFSACVADDRRTRLTDEAIGWLGNLNNLQRYQFLLTDQDFDVVRGHPRFQKFVSAKGFGYRVTKFQRADSRSSITLTGLSDHQLGSHALESFEKGLIPRCLSCRYLHDTDGLYGRVIWETPDSNPDMLAAQQRLSNAAILLAELGSPEIFDEVVANKYGQVVRSMLADAFSREVVPID